MDLDDVVKLLIPKSTRKAWKRRIKKQGVLGLLKQILRQLFASSPKNGGSTTRSSPAPTAKRSSAKQDEPLLSDLEQARIYQTRIEALALAAQPGSLERIRLTQLSERVAEWVHTIEAIVARTLAQDEDALLVAERKRVPAAIKRLEKQLDEAQDDALRQKLRRTLENRRRQLIQLEQAATNRQMAALKVENTIAQLGIIYSQLHSGRFLMEHSSYEHLAAEISDEVEGLGDYLKTLTELRQENALWR